MKYIRPHCQTINDVDHRPSAGVRVNCTDCDKRFILLSSRLARESDLEAAANQPAGGLAVHGDEYLQAVSRPGN